MSTAGLVVRDMAMSDLDEVMALEEEVFDTPWSVDIFRHELKRGRRSIYLVAEVNGKLVGYLGSSVVGQEVHITNIAVDPRHRRRKVGSGLLAELVNRCEDRGLRLFTLEVRRSNRAARGFYRSFGFKELGVRAGYYEDTGEDAVLMATCDLSGERPLEGAGGKSRQTEVEGG